MIGASSETVIARQLQDEAEDSLAEGELETARNKLRELRNMLDGVTGELVRLESSLAALEALAEDEEAQGVGVESD